MNGTVTISLNDYDILLKEIKVKKLESEIVYLNKVIDEIKGGGKYVFYDDWFGERRKSTKTITDDEICKLLKLKDLEITDLKILLDKEQSKSWFSKLIGKWKKN